MCMSDHLFVSAGLSALITHLKKVNKDKSREERDVEVGGGGTRWRGREGEREGGREGGGGGGRGRGNGAHQVAKCPMRFILDESQQKPLISITWLSHIWEGAMEGGKEDGRKEGGKEDGRKEGGKEEGRRAD